MRSAILSLIVYAGFALPSLAGAQIRDMRGDTPIKVTVRVSSVRLAGDTVVISYIVENRARPASGEDFWGLFVDTPIPAISVDTPSTKSWETATTYRDRPTADWTLLSEDLIHPGQSSPALTYRAIGVTGLVRYWAIPDLWHHMPVADDDSKGDDDAGFKVFGDSGMTIGVVPIPATATPSALATRLTRLFNYSCGTNQLITNSGICNSLRVKLNAASSSIADGNATAAHGQIDAFLDELDAQRGKFVSEAAYALLRPNAAFLLGKL